jgi:uncharacterized protein (DUF1800 family)
MLRRIVGVLCAAFAVAAQAQGVGAALGADDARFLLTRTGFAPTEAQVREFAPLSRAAAVERLLAGARAAARAAPPDWVAEPVQRPRLQQMSDEERRAFQQRTITRGFELRAWWMAEMLSTDSPLTERMTLFWHNHFTSSLQKVRVPQLIYRQNLLLRRHALGSFGDLLHAASKDPAMLIYLDAATSRRGAPNENFAREVMELFTLGEGRYGERDIKEAARAFTGWSLDPETLEFRYRPHLHDDGVKTILGRSGGFDGDAVLDILLAQPACAEFIAAKLWREFVAGEPAQADRAELRRIAGVLRETRYDIKSALRALFNSPRFYAPEHRAGLVKSPVELVVGTVRQLGVIYDDALPFAFAVAGLGQNLLAPPNVRGWPGGEAWITSATLLARKQFAERLLRVDEMRTGEMRAGEMRGAGRMHTEGRERLLRAAVGIAFDGERFLAQFSGQPPAALSRALLAGDPAAPPPAGTAPREALRAALLDPLYQLK